MRSQRKSIWRLSVLAGIATLVFTLQAFAGDSSRQFTEEFHHTYALSADGRVTLSNINGAAHIVGWDRNEVKVDAVKYGPSKERLDEAEIRVDAGNNHISIRTEYPRYDRAWNCCDQNYSASVEYTITVPRGARLDKISLINGGLDIKGVTGEIEASCINGPLVVNEVGGRAALSTVNGPLEAHLNRLGDSPLKLSSVNGSVSLTLPSDAGAELMASTVHGGISNDFGLKVDDHRWVGHGLHGTLGDGRTRIRLNNVNGAIKILHANDGRALSPAKNLNAGEDDTI